MLTWSLEHPYLTFVLVIFGMGTLSNIVKSFASKSHNLKAPEEKQHANNDFPEGEDLARLYEELAKKPPSSKVH